MKSKDSMMAMAWAIPNPYADIQKKITNLVKTASDCVTMFSNNTIKVTELKQEFETWCTEYKDDKVGATIDTLTQFITVFYFWSGKSLKARHVMSSPLDYILHRFAPTFKAP